MEREAASWDCLRDEITAGDWPRAIWARYFRIWAVRLLSAERAETSKERTAG
jgi:hypothetical protein